MEITLPNNWVPRPYQRPMWAHFENGHKRAFLVWHRRAGKDDNSLHFMATQMVQKTATYWYMLPEYAQARKAIWDAINPNTGQRRIYEAFPEVIRSSTRDSDMTFETVNGSRLNIVGSDNYNALVGSPPHGVVFSEFSLTNPLAWAYISPILEENGGWAIFNCTPRGRNHAARLFESKRKDPEWLTQLCLPADTGIFSEDQLSRIRQDYVDLYGEDDGDALFRQEYLCSWDAALVGAYYSKILEKLEAEKHIRDISHDPALPVFTAWDLGMDDSTAIWFVQVAGSEIRVIDYYEASGHGLDHYAKTLKDRGYLYGRHYMPHDTAVRELGTGRSRLEVLESLGIKDVEVLPAQNPADRIQAVRTILPRCWFDRTKCESGLNALRNYRREYDEERKIFKPNPFHDWSSHASDAFGQLAFGLKIEPKKERRENTYKARRLV